MNITEKESVINSDKVCRLCLSRKRTMLSIFDGDGTTFPVASRIMTYIGIEISISDGLPTGICNNCHNRIDAWHKFKEQCKQCDDFLHQCVVRKVKQGRTQEATADEPNLITRKDEDEKTESTHHKKELDVDGKSDAMNSSVLYHDFDQDSDKSELDVEVETLRRIEKDVECKTYGCSKCGKTFSYTNTFTFHTCNVSPEKRFVCNLCGKDYSTAGAVKTHLHIHKGKHKCLTCGKSFPSKFQVEVHTRIHTGEKPYVCEYCGKRFAYDKGLALHMSVHTGVKPYKCDECSYATTSRSYIKNHKSVHRAEKPFVCEVCGQGYTLLPSLLNHQLNHSDQKTYTCEVCSKAFNTGRKLASHKVMHSGVRPYHCEDCGKRFARREGLKEHKVIHTGEKKFVCLICKKQFAWRKILRTHKCVGASDCGK